MTVILGGRNDPLGLIEQIVHKGFMLQDPTGDCNLVSFLINLPLWRAFHLPIDSHLLAF